MDRLLPGHQGSPQEGEAEGRWGGGPACPYMTWRRFSGSPDQGWGTQLETAALPDTMGPVEGWTPSYPTGLCPEPRLEPEPAAIAPSCLVAGGQGW